MFSIKVLILGIPNSFKAIISSILPLDITNATAVISIEKKNPNSHSNIFMPIFT